jgi:cytochrome d ubiquinol oxidase subunit I
VDGQAAHLDMARFWTRIFGLIFAIGVATGIPMEFQIGTSCSPKNTGA